MKYAAKLNTAKNWIITLPVGSYIISVQHEHWCPALRRTGATVPCWCPADVFITGDKKRWKVNDDETVHEVALQ